MSIRPLSTDDVPESVRLGNKRYSPMNGDWRNRAQEAQSYKLPDTKHSGA